MFTKSSLSSTGFAVWVSGARASLTLPVLIVVMLALAGCKTGPNYRRPEIDTPQSWRFAIEEAEVVANTRWWEQFNDPVLNKLIETALVENKDLKIAAARVDQFDGLYRTTRGGLFPQVGAGASGARTRNTEITPKIEVPKSQEFQGAVQQLQGLNQKVQSLSAQVEALSSGAGTSYTGAGGASTLLSALGSVSQFMASTSTAKVENPVNSYQTGINASWELDLWGKLRRANEAARANLLAAEEGRRGVILSLVTAVAENYVNLRNLDRTLEIAEATVKTREDTYKLFKLRFEKGVISQLELSQVESQYEAARSTLPVIERAVAQQENALCMLLGRNPGPIPRGKTLDELALPAIPAGLPSGLLANRPDIRQSEQNLISANAQIGVARAQYFPSISLTGMFGWASTDFDGLFSGPAKTWNYSVPVTTPIFTGGAISGRVRTAKAAQQEALVWYQQTIQNAFREVEDSLIAVKSVREEHEAQLRQLDAFSTYARLARRRYDGGYSSYIEVLDAERGLFSAELAVAQTRGNLIQSLLSLYKVMGGGWPDALHDEMATRPTDPSEILPADRSGES